MILPYSDQLNIASLSRLFDSKAESYKLFWFQAIMNYVCQNRDIITFEELIDEMIADAWYMVTEYHLNLGPKDTLEKSVNYISEITDIQPSAKKQVILEWLKESTDKELNRLKRILIEEVPFRLQRPFIEGSAEKIYSSGSERRIERINQEKRLMYYFLAFNGMETKIYITPEWMEYLKENHEIIQGWIQYNMITYLQRRNPSVPGISDKLSRPQIRKLEKVKQYWKLLSEVFPIHEIYGESIITRDNISIDHFVPWSYVAHDELWNLHPTTRSINSRKSNNLPAWDIYFPKLANLEYRSYQMIWKYDNVHKAFEKCADEHLNNMEIKNHLYKEGLTEVEFKGVLEDTIYPVYHSAESCGFRSWEYIM